MKGTILASVILIMSNSVDAATYRCVVNGKLIFTDVACDGSSPSIQSDSNVSSPIQSLTNADSQKMAKLMKTLDFEYAKIDDGDFYLTAEFRSSLQFLVSIINELVYNSPPNPAIQSKLKRMLEREHKLTNDGKLHTSGYVEYHAKLYQALFFATNGMR